MQTGSWNELMQVSVARHGALPYFGKADTENDTEADTEYDTVNELCMHNVLQLLELDTHRSSLCRAPSRHGRIVACTRVCALPARSAKTDAKTGQQCCRQGQNIQVNRHS